MEGLLVHFPRILYLFPQWVLDGLPTPCLRHLFWAPDFPLSLFVFPICISHLALYHFGFMIKKKKKLSQPSALAGKQAHWEILHASLQRADEQSVYDIFQTKNLVTNTWQNYGHEVWQQSICNHDCSRNSGMNDPKKEILELFRSSSQGQQQLHGTFLWPGSWGETKACPYGPNSLLTFLPALPPLTCLTLPLKSWSLPGSAFNPPSLSLSILYSWDI